jgi:hypothetical protein
MQQGNLTALRAGISPDPEARHIETVLASALEALISKVTADPWSAWTIDLGSVLSGEYSYRVINPPPLRCAEVPHGPTKISLVPKSNGHVVISTGEPCIFEVVVEGAASSIRKPFLKERPTPAFVEAEAWIQSFQKLDFFETFMKRAQDVLAGDYVYLERLDVLTTPAAGERSGFQTQILVTLFSQGAFAAMCSRARS